MKLNTPYYWFYRVFSSLTNFFHRLSSRCYHASILQDFTTINSFETKIDENIWKHKLITDHYRFTFMETAISNLGIDQDKEIVFDYASSREICLLMKDESLAEKMSKEYIRLTEIGNTVDYVEDFASENFDALYHQTFNPEMKNYIKIIPTAGTEGSLIVALIKYYEDNGFKINRQIFNELLFVPDSTKTYIRVYADSEAMASEISLLLMHNDLAEIID